MSCGRLFGALVPTSHVAASTELRACANSDDLAAASTHARVGCRRSLGSVDSRLQWPGEARHLLARAR
jgi:hypothetical protein